MLLAQLRFILSILKFFITYIGKNLKTFRESEWILMGLEWLGYFYVESAVWLGVSTVSRVESAVS